MIEEKSLHLENAVLVGVINGRQDETQSKEYMDELEFLTFTAGGKVLKRYTQKIDPPNPKTFIGSGKMMEVLEFVKANDVSSVIFDDELTPAQQGNIEKMLKVKKPGLWFSTNSKWEYSAFKRFNDGKKEFDLNTPEEFEKYIGCARLVTNLNSLFVTFA